MRPVERGVPRLSTREPQKYGESLGQEVSFPLTQGHQEEHDSSKGQAQAARPEDEVVHTMTEVPLRSKKDRAKRPIVFVEYGRPPDDSPSQKLVTDSKRQREVRVHAAMASAAARKATIARREAQRRQQRSQAYPALRVLASEMQTRRTVAGAKHDEHERAASSVVDQYRFHQLVQFVTELQGDRVWYLGPVERTSLAHQAMRTNLAYAMTNSTTLYQAAIFVAGTFANTCGLPSSAVHMGSGLIMLRGASLEAIQAAVTANGADALTPVAIAMLAGWEQRFGDQESYRVHMLAWRSLSLPPRALEEGHVATLTNLTLETLRASLDDRVIRPVNDANSLPDTQPFSKTNTSATIRPRFQVPVGFSMFHLGRPEAKSLLSIVVEASVFDPSLPDSVPRMRTLGIENLAWSANHSVSCEPVQAYEDAWIDEELTALYHVRAANVSIFGVLLQAAMQHHKLEWGMDLQGALDVHTVSCQHLRTQSLVRTQFEELAFWTRFILCTISRDPPRDEMILSMMNGLGIHTWDNLRVVLAKYIPLEHYIGLQCRTFFDCLHARQYHM